MARVETQNALSATARRRCAHCRRQFKPVRKHQKYCRPSCRWKGFVARHQQEPSTLPLFPDGDG